LIDGSPDANAVLEALVNHHLLIAGAGARRTVGFVHQRFQEWFGAEHLAQLHSTGRAEGSRIQEICDRVAWGESLGFLMDRWKAEREDGLAERLVRLALPVDPSLAVGLTARAAPAVWNSLKPDLGQLL